MFGFDNFKVTVIKSGETVCTFKCKRNINSLYTELKNRVNDISGKKIKINLFELQSNLFLSQTLEKYSPDYEICFDDLQNLNVNHLIRLYKTKYSSIDDNVYMHHLKKSITITME